MTLIKLLIALALLLLNAFFVLAQFAIVKVRASRLEELTRRETFNAILARQIIQKLDAYLSVIQLGSTMASLGIGWIGEPAVAALLHPLFKGLPTVWASTFSHGASFAVAFALITFLHVVVGELAPKSIAIRSPTSSVLMIAVPLQVFYKLFYLPMRLLNGTSNLLLRLTGLGRPSEPDMLHSDEELKILLSQSHEIGKLPLSRLLLFENLFDFSRATVKEVMNPRESIAYLSLSKSWNDNLAVIRSRKHSRYPLIRNTMEDIAGMVHLKDLSLSEDSFSGNIPKLGALARKVHYAHETDPLEKAMRDIRENRSHLALVKNNEGRIVGLVTLEDILEELVGEIQDEFEPSAQTMLANVLVPEAIDLAIGVPGKAAAINTLLRKLRSARPELNYQEAWNVIWQRELALTSAVGGGMALPHGRLLGLSKPLVALGKSNSGVEFNALDRKPVKLIFLILTPAKAPGTMLRILSQVASLASNETFKKNLMRAKNPQAVMEIIHAFDQTVAV